MVGAMMGELFRLCTSRTFVGERIASQLRAIAFGKVQGVFNKQNVPSWIDLICAVQFQSLEPAINNVAHSELQLLFAKIR
jgi:hypothetical protein